MWLGMAADSFLCPCLTAMSSACQMTENVAGLTFLALGNGAPDIFSQIAATIASPHGAEMALGESSFYSTRALLTLGESDVL